MRKIINGKIYDTDKATEVDRISIPWDEYPAVKQNIVLYVTRNGRFFLFRVEDDTWFDEEFTPLSQQEALEWAEQHSDTETLLTHFADMVEEA